jgi:hypothetical protein
VGGKSVGWVLYCVCVFLFLFFLWFVKMYMNAKKVAMVTLEGEQSGLSHLVAQCNGHLGACGMRSHA